MMEMTPAESKKKRMKRIEDSFRDLWDNIKHTNMHKEHRNSKEKCTPMFLAALFTLASTWKQPNVHPQRDG